MNEIVMYLLSGVITVCMTVATKAAVEWLRQKKLLTAAKIAVEAAEQMMGSGTGPLKKEQAKEYILKQFPKLSAEDLDAIIEAAVLGLNRGLERTA